MKTKLGGVLTSPALFDDGKKNHEEPALRVSAAVFFPARTARELGDPAAVQTTNLGISLGSVPSLGANGTGADDVAMELGAKNVFNTSLSPFFVSPYGIELDLDAYVNDPASRQPTKKALSEDQTLLVTAAWSTSTSASPTRVSLYSNKRTAMSSPAKGGMAPPKFIPPPCGNNRQPVFPLQKFRVPPSVNCKKVFNASLGMQEIQWEADDATWRMQMGPFDKIMAAEEKADAAKEHSCLLRIKLLREKFEHAARQKGNGLLMDTPPSKDGTDAPDFDDDGIYGRIMTMKMRTSATICQMDWQKRR
jgi:hypothetical protein